MSHRIIGLDVGTHSVKAIQVVSRVRGYHVVAYDEERVHASEAAESAESGGAAESAEAAAQADRVLPAGAIGALAALRQRGMLDGDVTVIGYGLEHCLQTRLELPFSQRRQIEAVLPAQIEERFPVDYEELVSDFQVAEPAGGGEGLRQVAVVATRTVDLRAFLAALAEVKVDPRVIEVGPAGLMAAHRLLYPGPDLAERLLLVDVGHRFTDICLVDGERLRGMRRLRLGGEQVTERLARTLSIPVDEAERLKHHEAAVDPSGGAGAPAVSGQVHLRMREVCRAWAQELADEVLRSLHGFPGSTEAPVQRVFLCGGGGALRGLPQFLATALQIPVEVLAVPEAGAPGSGMRAVGALGLAARGLGQRVGSELNLRRGPFAFRGDFDFLKARALPVAILAGLAVVALIFTLIAQHAALAARRDAYRQALCQTSNTLLGHEVCDPAEVMRQLGQVQGSIQLPEHNAYDIFRDISSELVYLRDDAEVPVEIERMTVDIQRDIISIRGSTDSAASVDDIISQLSGLECLEGLSTESTTQNRSTGLFDFVLRATNRCS